jgi:hypothetical protein
MIRPGDLDVVKNDYTDYAGSMAALIEAELNRLLLLDDLPALPDDPDDREVRDRRRLFVAIARAVVRHLVDEAGSIEIVRADGTSTSPIFHTEGI